MSEGVSEVLRSNQRSSLKRRRTEDSGGSTGRSGCRYGGCRRPGRLENGTGIHHPFCSLTHRDFHMAGLFDMLKDGAQGTDMPTGICKLPGCDLQVWMINSTTAEAFDFCKRGHALKYKEDMTEQWDLEGRLCKFETCFNHVNVEETSNTIHEYCCRDHAFKAAAARGKQAAAAKRKLVAAAKGVSLIPQDPQNPRIGEPARPDGERGPSSSDDFRRPKSTFQEAARQRLHIKTEKKRGYNDTVSCDTMEHSLRHLVINPGDFVNADPSGLFHIVTNITEFLPFHDVTEFGGFVSRYYLHYVDAASNRQRSIKQGFGWKQTSRDHENKSTDQHLKTKYFHLERKERGDSKDDHSDGYVMAYDQYEEEKKAKKLQGTKKRWRLYEYFLSHDLIKELTGGILPSKIPIISKIFQEKRGLPVWPPLPQEKETRDMDVIANEKIAPVPMGTIPQATFHVEERAMTSSVSSNASPPGAALPPRGGTLQGENSNTSEESDDFAPLQDTPMELIGNESKAPVPVEPVREVTFHFEENGMTRSIWANASPPGEGRPHGQEILQRDHSSKFEESDDFVFLQDTLMTSPRMEAIANESNEPVLAGTIPTVRFQDEWGMTSSSSSNPSLGEGLLPMSSDYSFLDDINFDQNNVGGDNMFSWCMDSDGLQRM